MVLGGGMQKRQMIFLVLITMLFTYIFPCTIGIIRGDLTDSGRPMIWKTRDSSNIINYPIYDDSGLYPFIGLTHDINPDQTWAGVNTQGFALLNALSLDLDGPSGLENGFLITHALKHFSTLSEFEAYLDSTSSPDRRINGNFAAIDSDGNGAMYEIANNTYDKYDVNTSETGYIIRTNFSLAGGDTNGIERYTRSHLIINDLVSRDDFSVQNLIDDHFRDFSDSNGNSFPIPYEDSTNGHFGYIRINVSICNHISTSSQAIVGINASDQTPVMWTLAGFPAVTPAIPFIPAPFTFDATQISALSQEIKRLLSDIPNTTQLLNTQHFYTDNWQGIWDRLSVFEYATRNDFEQMVLNNDFTSFDSWLANRYSTALSLMNNIKGGLANSENDSTTPFVSPFSISTYPNPTFGSFNISVKNQNTPNAYTVEIFNIRGQLIQRHLLGRDISSTTFTIDERQPNGVYIIKVSDNEQTVSRKLLRLK